MKITILTLIISTFISINAFTAQAQTLYTSAGVTNQFTYVDVGANVSDNSSVFMTASFNSTTDQYFGFGYSYMKVINERINMISGLDTKALVFDELGVGGSIQLKSGLRFNYLDITLGLEYLIDNKYTNPRQTVYPKLQISLSI